MYGFNPDLYTQTHVPFERLFKLVSFLFKFKKERNWAKGARIKQTLSKILIIWYSPLQEGDYACFLY